MDPITPDQDTPPTEHQKHASVLHSLLKGLEDLIHLASSPEVMAILPPKYRAYVTVVSAVDAAVESATK